MPEVNPLTNIRPLIHDALVVDSHPMLTGYALGHNLPNISILPTILINTGCLILAFKAQASSIHSLTASAWPFLFFIGVSTSSPLYFQDQRRVPDLWQSLPPREANLRARAIQALGHHLDNYPETIGVYRKRMLGLKS